MLEAFVHDPLINWRLLNAVDTPTTPNNPQIGPPVSPVAGQPGAVGGFADTIGAEVHVGGGVFGGSEGEGGGGYVGIWTCLVLRNIPTRTYIYSLHTLHKHTFVQMHAHTCLHAHMYAYV